MKIISILSIFCINYILGKKADMSKKPAEMKKRTGKQSKPTKTKTASESTKTSKYTKTKGPSKQGKPGDIIKQLSDIETGTKEAIQLLMNKIGKGIELVDKGDLSIDSIKEKVRELPSDQKEEVEKKIRNLAGLKKTFVNMIGEEKWEEIREKLKQRNTGDKGGKKKKVETETDDKKEDKKKKKKKEPEEEETEDEMEDDE
eukprot:GHVP01012475.1.p2 GENE.GHVP01012475.1~~GHVP01012475.1.p2  ORF type:complete len:201 (+),score=64.20 GHVP01012475.1:3110-3712(+)